MRSIRTRLVASTLTMVVTTLTSLVVVTTVKSDSFGREQATEYTSQLAQTNAAQVQEQLAGSVRTVTDLAGGMAALRQRGALTRAAASELVRATLEAHPEFVGMGTGWEQNALDGRDAEFAGTADTDATGRVIPYWFRSGGSLAVTPLTDLDDATVSTWYWTPKQTGEVFFTEPYEYAVDGETVLMATAAAPVVVDGTFLGVVTADLSLTSLTESMAAIEPYGTGFASLMTDAATVVTSPDADALGAPATGAAKDLALAVASSGTTATTSTGDSLVAVAPVRVDEDQTWTLLVSAPSSSALAASHSLRTTTVLLGVLAVLVAGVVTWVIGTGISRPIARLRDSLADIADGDGDLTKRVDETRRDELGQLGGAFNRFAETIAGTVREVSAEAETLAGAATRLDGTRRRLGEDVSATAQRSGLVADQAGTASEEVTGISVAADQMGLAISEIARGTHDASRIAAEAVDVARSTEQVISELSSSSAEISEIVAAITSIAQQTNLLALNATIEAARAGDAGKGFAVVAGEVKELSLQTARATEDVEHKIAALQGSVTQAAGSVAHIGTVIDRLDEIQATVAAAVEEQSAVTGDLATGVSRAAEATRTIAGTIGEVAQVAERTTASAAETDECSRQVAGAAEHMRALVGRFKV
ncbi:methyl-accepting chemotaxis protein [Kineococcus sp. SYSU DK001]|uniref:methyl-accepting chemotaxis protein n=1 Tax=Kineococcus sp. SYSU DK001 TaxID=3383122 RepID=UPI003D7D5468